jgi:hypothetical protein
MNNNFFFFSFKYFKIFQIKCKRCQAHNEINLNFRSISDSHVESNLFEIFKFKDSSIISINCWLKICESNSDCLQHLCAETASLSFLKATDIFGNKKSIVTRNVEKEATLNKEVSIFKQTNIRVIVEDPYGLAQKTDKNKNQPFLPNSVGQYLI